ncbi:hypothetical protein K435DRAFT_719909 [Dendrothele bispora CBS 962.96]|uniref:C2H2-type domain-containing protein n=1 Tax=Dendrothele bispora (strain CBS 962.96) TaxID=1314807 RepID=A0A4S8MAI0_DENBC|nr:hypothetical protein K435DRAFT_719909 [Dendrothele bispora CBS 962.96]
MNHSSASSPPVLPSIHEMFPEHLLSVPPSVRLSIMATVKKSSLGIVTNDFSNRSGHAARALSSNHPAPPSSSTASRSTINGVHRSTSKFTDLPEVESSLPQSTSPSSSISPSWVDDDVGEPEVDEGDDTTADTGKKHRCPRCFKRFNRPSSLRIHENTHTGETPFQCPYPGCGRMFNVNSNMRRHYRNHVTAANSSSHGSEVQIDPRLLPRQRGKRNAKRSMPELTANWAGSSSSSTSSHLSAPMPVLKKAQWPSRSLDDMHTQDWSDTASDSTDDNMDVDTDKFHPNPNSVADRSPSQSKPTPSSFNYPVYVSRNGRPNRAPPNIIYGSPPCEDSHPRANHAKHGQRRTSPTQSPRNSLYAIANLIR